MEKERLSLRPDIQKVVMGEFKIDSWACGKLLDRF
jgi:hypothetical protein